MNLTLNNFLSNLKNASLKKNTVLIVKFNESFLPIIKILYSYGFILNYNKTKNFLFIRLSYFYHLNQLKNFKIMSKISKAVYLNKTDITKIYKKNRLLVLSTSQGILTSLDCKKLKIGGKLIIIC